MQGLTTFNNYVFISYNHKDTKEADELVRRLDKYLLPVSIHKKHPDKERKIRRIFRDKDSMGAGGNLPDVIKNELDDSRYLVVICSPNSAKSEWVNKEIRHFRSVRQSSKYILPFIIDGEPHSKDDSRECFPSELLVGVDPACADVTKVGWDCAFVQLLSGLYEIKYDELWNRYELARRRRRNIIIATALLVTATAKTKSTFATPQATPTTSSLTGCISTW